MAVLWISAEDTVDPTGEVTEWAIQYASWILYKLSGEKYPGIQTTTEYYSLDTSGSLTFAPRMMQGQIYNLPRHMNNTTNRLRLRRTPVNSVQSVRIAGELIDPEEYELRNNAYLVRKNNISWILDRNLEIEVSYTHGTPPPKAGRLAAQRLANEFIWSETDSDMCTLPERISSVARQGVTYTILDPQDFLQNGKTGVYMVDLFLSAANPNKAKKKPKVFIPNKPRGERIN